MVVAFTSPLDIAYRDYMGDDVVNFLDNLEVSMWVCFIVDLIFSFFTSEHVSLCSPPSPPRVALAAPLRVSSVDEGSSMLRGRTTRP